MRTLLLLGSVSAILVSACATTPSAGDGRLWAGSLQLCEGMVADMTEAYDLTGQPALRITLTESATEKLSLITARMIGEKLPIRLGDKVLVEPVVQERIAGGVFDISPLPDQDLERIKRAMGASC